MRKSYILILAYLPFYLNDFANMADLSYPVWVAMDYTTRFAILGLLYTMYRRGDLAQADLGLTMPPLTDLMLWTSATLALAMGYLYLSEFVLAPFYPKGALGGVPVDENSALFFFDLSFGLILVGFSEEAVCRGLTLSVFRDRLSPVFLTVVSALLFSFMHWSLSVHTLVDAFVYGLIFVPATFVTRSILPAAFVHFCVNFVLYTL